MSPDALSLPAEGTAVRVTRRPPGSSPVTRPPAMATTRSASGTESCGSCEESSTLAPSATASPDASCRGEGTRDGLRLSGIDPAGIFLGKAAAIALQLLALQLVLWAGVTFLFDVRVHVVWLAVVASLLATVGLACAGVLYGALSAGLRVRDTLLPLLVLPVLAPVLLAGSKMWEAALSGNAASGTQWLKILVPFAVVYFVVGIVLYGPLQEAA